MIIYNITTKVQVSINESWLQWQVDHHIPAIMATGAFTSFKILRLLEQDDSEGDTFAIQYQATDIEAYYHYMALYAPMLQQQAFQQWGDKTISFRSVMEVIQ